MTNCGTPCTSAVKHHSPNPTITIDLSSSLDFSWLTYTRKKSKEEIDRWKMKVGVTWLNFHPLPTLRSELKDGDISSQNLCCYEGSEKWSDI